MTWFKFSGNDSLGNTVSGQHKADSEFSLISRLKSVGITQVSIQKIGALRVACYAIKEFASRFIRVRKLDLSVFYCQLADMLEIGIPLKQALLVIASHLNHPRLISIIRNVVAGLSRGLSFAEAMHQHRRIFSSVTLQLVALAHTKEELTAILRYCDQSMRRMTILSKIFFVVLPQISMTIILLVILLFLRFHYLPSFYYAISVFRNPTPQIIHIFDLLTGLLTVHVLKTVVISIIVFIACRSILLFFAKIRFFFDIFLYYFPVVGSVVIALERERLSLLYSVLLKGGASVQQCALYSVAVVSNLFFKRRVKATSMAIRGGETFSSALKYYHVFNAAEVQMIALGAAANSLVKMFGRIYNVSQMILERKLMILLECIRFFSYLLNTALIFFIIFVVETLFFYPGVH